MMEEEVNATLYPLWAKIVTTHGAFIRRFVVIPESKSVQISWEYVFVVEVHIGVLTVTNNKYFTVASAPVQNHSNFQVCIIQSFRYQFCSVVPKTNSNFCGKTI